MLTAIYFSCGTNGSKTSAIKKRFKKQKRLGVTLYSELPLYNHIKVICLNVNPKFHASSQIANIVKSS